MRFLLFNLKNFLYVQVADLKQILKQRGLSLVGNKSDLIQRLQTAMINESQSQLLFNIDKQFVNIKDQSKVEIDEDAILGDDDDGQIIRNDDSLIQNEDLLLSETLDTEKLTRTTTSNMMKSTPLVNVQTTTKSVNLKEKTKNPSSEPKSIISAPETTQIIKPTKTTKNLSAEEQKRLRSLKFADPKLMNRAQRFGIATKEETQPTEEKKLLQRMERFGEAVSTKVKNLNEQERLKRRQERFGITNGQNNKSSSSISTVPAINSNILKRQQRFGIVEKTVGNTNNVSLFNY